MMTVEAVKRGLCLCSWERVFVFLQGREKAWKLAGEAKRQRKAKSNECQGGEGVLHERQ